MFMLIGRTSKVVGKLEFWITLKKISSLMYKEALHHSYHDLFLLFGSQELKLVIWETHLIEILCLQLTPRQTRTYFR